MGTSTFPTPSTLNCLTDLWGILLKAKSALSLDSRVLMIFSARLLAAWIKSGTDMIVPD
jgi:hypothetical protein